MQTPYHTTDLNGETLICPDPAAMREVLESLEDADDYGFPDVSLIHESGWAITVDAEWTAVLERVPDDEETPARMLDCGSLASALNLWQQLAGGKLDALLSLPWIEQDPGSL